MIAVFKVLLREKKPLGVTTCCLIHASQGKGDCQWGTQTWP